MKHSLQALRRQAADLKKSYHMGAATACARLKAHPPRHDLSPLKHADFLHVVAQENGFASWPALKLAAETTGLDRAARLQRLKIAVAQGQNRVVTHLLTQTPDLAAGVLGVQIALYQWRDVERALALDPARATQALGPRSAILHLAFSKYIQARPDLEIDMLAIADLLLAHGANVNDALPVSASNEAPLSALYGALAHADNMPLARRLLAHGANPNDGESLYHATELSHHQGLDLLLGHGANPKGTNALLRAMDFHDHSAVRKLLAAGADVNEFAAGQAGAEAPWVIPALHQAARRMCDADMIAILLQAGAAPDQVWQGASAYGYARVFGNQALAQALEKTQITCDLSQEETLLAAAAAEGVLAPTLRLATPVSKAYQHLIGQVLPLPGKLTHLKNLIALGLDPDQPDAQGMTPVQLAGWEGLPDLLAYFLSLHPMLDHVNGYGGTLLTTILHGAQNAPNRASRDHLACVELALNAGVAFPLRVIDFAQDEDIAAVLADWAAAHPAQISAG